MDLLVIGRSMVACLGSVPWDRRMYGFLWFLDLLLSTAGRRICMVLDLFRAVHSVQD